MVRHVDGKYHLEYPLGKVLYESASLPPAHVQPHSSDGTVAFFGHNAAIGDYDVLLVDGASRVRVLSRSWRTLGGLGWSPDRKEIWFSAAKPSKNSGIFAVDLSGQERVLVEAPGFMLLQDVSRDGSALAAVVNTKLTIRALGSLAPSEIDLGWMDASRVYDISADGKTIVFVEFAYGEGRNVAIYLRKTDGAQAVKIGYGVRPALSPDSKWIACGFHQANSTVLRILPAGAGEERTLDSHGLQYESAEWFADQKRLLVVASEPGKGVQTFTYALDGDLAPQRITGLGERATKPSPNGRYAVSVEGNRLRLIAIPPHDESPRDLGEWKPGAQILRWNDQGTALIGGRPIAGGVELFRFDVATRVVTKLREIRYPEDNAEFVSLVASPGGNWYALSYQKDLGELYLVRGLAG